jgi:hypothetical protein
MGTLHSNAGYQLIAFRARRPSFLDAVRRIADASAASDSFRD